MVELTGLAGGAPAAADDGSAPPAVAAAMAARLRGTLGLREVAEALAGARLLVPLLEVSGAELEGSDTDPCAGQDRAVAAVSLRSPDGPVGLGFTSTSALARWSALARPWPTPAPRAAAAVLAEGGARLVVDAASPERVELCGHALRRLAGSEVWPDPWDDPAVRAAVVGELGAALASRELAVRLGPPPPGSPRRGLLVELAFPAELDPGLARRRAEVLGSRLGADPALREVFDGALLVRPTVRGRS